MKWVQACALLQLLGWIEPCWAVLRAVLLRMPCQAVSPSELDWFTSSDTLHSP